MQVTMARAKVERKPSMVNGKEEHISTLQPSTWIIAPAAVHNNYSLCTFAEILQNLYQTGGVALFIEDWHPERAEVQNCYSGESSNRGSLRSSQNLCSCWLFLQHTSTRRISRMSYVTFDIRCV